MKYVSIAYLCTLDRLLREHRMSSVSHAPLFNRTVHVLFTSDEVIGSPIFSLFVPSPFFRSAFALDEGICSPYGQFIAYHSERFRTAASVSEAPPDMAHCFCPSQRARSCEKLCLWAEVQKPGTFVMICQSTRL